jgi:hypothetical protein
VTSQEPHQQEDPPKDRYQQIAGYLLGTAAASMFFNLFSNSIGYRGVAIVALIGGLVAMVRWLRRLPPRTAGGTTRHVRRSAVSAPRPGPTLYDPVPEHDGRTAGTDSVPRRKTTGSVPRREATGATSQRTDEARALLASIIGIFSTLVMVGGLIGLGRNHWPWIVVIPMLGAGVATVIIVALGLDDSEDPSSASMAFILVSSIYQIPWMIGLGIHIWRGAHGEPGDWGLVAWLVGIEVALLAAQTAFGWRRKADQDRAR